MKIYLLTQGEYSNYHVTAAFSTEEKAEAVKAGLDDPTAGISEIELDEIDAPPPGLKLYFIWMDRTGKSNVSVWSKSLSEPIGEFCLRGNPHIQVWARNQKHAVKIANEKRTQMIALNQWPE